MNFLHQGERLRDYVGRRPTTAQTALASTAFLALSAALLLSFTRTCLGAAQTSEALLLWTAAFAFVGSLSASGLVWAMTVNMPEIGPGAVDHRRDSKPCAFSSRTDAAIRHPASLSRLIDILDARSENWTQAH